MISKAELCRKAVICAFDMVCKLEMYLFGAGLLCSKEQAPFHILKRYG
jgi:hypothetical protein